jgi:Icc-related predicted phosphoesterase
MKICCISDTHNMHRELDDFFSAENVRRNCIDVVVHAGDFTDKGTYGEVEAFVEWFSNLPIKHKVLIAGNHEITLDSHRYNRAPATFLPDEADRHRADETLDLLLRAHLKGRLYYLENDSVVIEGVKFYGSPFSVTPPFKNQVPWGFQYNETVLAKVWEAIPADVDVLVTHTPPKGVMDSYKKLQRGSASLLEVLPKLDLSLHVFGHVHAQRGAKVVDDVIYVNAACVNGKRKIEAGTQPFLIEIESNGNGNGNGNGD